MTGDYYYYTWKIHCSEKKSLSPPVLLQFFAYLPHLNVQCIVTLMQERDKANKHKINFLYDDLIN